MKKIVWVVEDDALQAPRILKALQHERLSLLHVETESHFLERCQKTAGHEPDLVVLDVALPWDVRSPHATPIPAGKDSDEAGLRCHDKLCAEHPQARILFYTYTDLPAGRRHLNDIWLHKDRYTAIDLRKRVLEELGLEDYLAGTS